VQNSAASPAKGHADERGEDLGSGAQRVLAKASYREHYEADSLIPTLMGRDEARTFHHRFCRGRRSSFRDLGLIR